MCTICAVIVSYEHRTYQREASARPQLLRNREEAGRGRLRGNIPGPQHQGRVGGGPEGGKRRREAVAAAAGVEVHH